MVSLSPTEGSVTVTTTLQSGRPSHGSGRSARRAWPALTARRITRWSRGRQSWLTDWACRGQDAQPLVAIKLGGAIGRCSARSLVSAAREWVSCEEGREGGGVVIVIDVWAGEVGHVGHVGGVRARGCGRNGYPYRSQPVLSVLSCKSNCFSYSTSRCFSRAGASSH